jgi:hypothetical protein
VSPIICDGPCSGEKEDAAPFWSGAVLNLFSCSTVVTPYDCAIMDAVRLPEIGISCIRES